MNDRVILPMILEQAWEKQVVVFSSNPSHVNKGALFALYPDNEGMGRTLGALADNILAKKRPASPGLLPLRDLLTATNLRTAEHLGIQYTQAQREEFSLVFPSP